MENEEKPVEKLCSAQPESGTFRMPASLIVDELERAMGGILVASFPGPQLKKLLADLRGALMGDLATLRKTVGEWREHHRAMVKERDAALGELKQASAELTLAKKDLATVEDSVRVLRQRCGEQLAEIERLRGDRERAYKALSTMPAPSEIAKLEAANAGLRRDVENHLAAQSYVASALDVATIGSWEPIKERLMAICQCVGTSPDRGGDLLSKVHRLVDCNDSMRARLQQQIRDLNGQLSTCQENETQFSLILRSLATNLGVTANWPDIRDKVLGLAMELEEAKHSAKQWSDTYERDQHRIAKLISEKEALEAQIGRLGRAYQMEMDARRTLADTNTKLDNVMVQMRERVSKLEKRVDLLKALKEVEGHSPKNEDLKEEDA